MEPKKQQQQLPVVRLLNEIIINFSSFNETLNCFEWDSTLHLARMPCSCLCFGDAVARDLFSWLPVIPNDMRWWWKKQQKELKVSVYRRRPSGGGQRKEVVMATWKKFFVFLSLRPACECRTFEIVKQFSAFSKPDSNLESLWGFLTASKETRASATWNPSIKRTGKCSGKCGNNRKQKRKFFVVW